MHLGGGNITRVGRPDMWSELHIEQDSISASVVKLASDGSGMQKSLATLKGPKATAGSIFTKFEREGEEMEQKPSLRERVCINYD